MNRVLVQRWLAATCLAGLVLSVHAQEAGQKPCMLFMSARVEQKPPGNPSKYRLRSFLPDEKLQKKLAEWGYIWAADFFSTEMTWEFLSQFNAIVALDFPNIERHREAADGIRAVETLLQRYVAAGGGLFLTSALEASQWGLERNTEELNRFLAPYGASVVIEQVEEQNPVACLPRPRRRGSISRLGWTDNVTAHALTEGVPGLLYPIDYGSMCYYTHPAQVDDSWTVLLRGSKTARSVTARLGAGTAHTTKKPGTIAGEPALLAVREAGQGRIVLWPTIPTATIIDGYHEFWGSGIIMTASDEQHPSSGERLLQNLFAWLTAPSMGTLGGYVAPPKEEEKEPGLHSINWDKVQLPPKHFPNTHKGLIGLRSTLSDGSSTPEELIQAARAAGYHFAAFSEDLAALTETELESLKSTCLKHCDETFQAYVGFTYRDASGNTWQVFGNALHWPRDDWWHDREAGTITKNNLIFRGYQFLPLIMVHPNRNPEKPWFQGNFKGMALHTYDGGKLLDDATDVYLRLQGDDYRLFPVVIHFVRTPEEVKRAAAPEMPQTYVPWQELEDVLSAMSKTTPQYKGDYVFHWTPFVSSGPSLESFRVINFGTSDLAIPGNDRFRMHLHLTSESGLVEVRILDGTKLWRRVALGGERDWLVTLDGFHDRTHRFVVIATDSAGRVLTSSVCGTSVQELNVPRCTDNLNTYTSGKFKAVGVFPLRGLENYFPIQSGCFGYFPKIPGVEETERLAVDQRLTHVSRFGYIRTDVLEYFYPRTATSNWNQNDLPEFAQPQTAIKGATRLTLFTPWADGTAVYHVRGDLEILRELSVPRQEAVVYNLQWIEDAETFAFSFRDKPMLCACLKPRKRSRRGSCDNVEYIANIAPFPGARGFVPLSEGMEYAAMQQGSSEQRVSALVSFLKFPDETLKAGDKHSYEYLAVFSEVRDGADTMFVEDLFVKMGLRGETAYTVTPTIGKVIDTRFVLRLGAADYGFRATVTQAALPMRLPVFIDGLNERWPAGVWYKGRHQFIVPTWTMDKMHNRYSKRAKAVHKDWVVPFGVTDGIGMLQLDTEIRDKDVFIGNLVVCDNPEVFLQLDDTRKGRVAISANNPTDKDVTVTVRPGPGFDLIGAFAETLTIPAGGLVTVRPPK